MLATQYKIQLPKDFDMTVIKDRIIHNAHKTDGFEGLYYKFYLIAQNGINGAIENEYCPLYLWRQTEGFNQFVFEGFYDNILKSFGWQQINIGITLVENLSEDMTQYTYLYESYGVIEPQDALVGGIKEIKSHLLTDEFEHYVVIYNPDKWQYAVFYFSKSNSHSNLKLKCYDILHVSKG